MARPPEWCEIPNDSPGESFCCNFSSEARFIVVQVSRQTFNSPAWLTRILNMLAAPGPLTPAKMSNLRPGEAFFWSSKATDEAFTKSAVKIRCSPHVTHQGGVMKTAVAS